jgi:PAS domain S-box-containing protein
MDMDDYQSHVGVRPLRKELFFSAVVILLLILGGYAYHATTQVPAKIAESSATMKMTDSMRMTFKVSIMARRGFETYLLALRNKDEDQVLDALDFTKASLGFAFSEFIENGKLVEQVVPLIRDSLERMETAMLQPSEETLSIIESNTGNIHLLTEQIEKDIWIKFQKDFIEFEKTEQEIQFLYKLVLLATVFTSFILLYVFVRQKRLNRDLLRTEAGLRESEHLLREAQTLARLGNWDLDLRTGIARWSEEEYRLLGYFPDKVDPSVDNFMKCVHPEDRDAVTLEMQRAMKPGEEEPYRIVHRVITPNGERLLEQQGRVEFSAEGQALRMFGTTADVTDVRRYQQELERYRDHLEDLVEDRTRSLEKEIADRKLAQEELRKNEDRLRQILESSDAGISILRRKPVRRIFANQRFLELFGARDLDEIEAAGPLATFVSQSEGQEAVSRLERGEIYYRKIIRRKRLNGEVIWILMATAPIEFEGDAATIVWHYDVTDQKRAEEELVQTRLEAKDRMLEQLTERLRGMVYQFQMDPEGKIRFPYASQGIRQIYEVEPEEVMNDASVVFSRIHPDDLQDLSDSIAISRDELSPWREEYRVRLPARGERWLFGDSVPEKQDDGSVLWHGYISDITDLKHSELELEKYRDKLEDLVEERTRDLEREIEERKAAQIELRRSEERHRQILDSSSAGISILRLNPVKRVYANQRFLELFHAGSTDEMDAFGFKNTFLQEADHDAATECMNKGLGFERFIMERRCIDGETWWGLLDAIPIEYEGAPATIVWHYDITDQKLAEKELVQAEKLASLGGLVAGIAHEVNTPIGVSVTAATYLEEKVSEISEQIAAGNLKKRNLSAFLETAKESSSIITSNLHRASDLVRSFKQVAVDQSSEERRTFKVLDYFDEVVQSLHPQLKKTRHEIIIQGDRSLVLTSYPGALSQIITNLVMNSLTHAFDEGEAGHIRIEAKKNAKAAHIKYRDDGKGVPPEALRHIFDPFFTTSRGTGGSGLGMNIVYNLVTQKLGGTVVCDSKLGEGISVHITVPYEQGEAE